MVNNTFQTDNGLLHKMLLDYMMWGEEHDHIVYEDCQHNLKVSPNN